MTAAAIAHQESDEIGKRWERRTVEDGAPCAARSHEPRLLKLSEMKRHAGRGCAPHSLADSTSGQALWPGRHEKPNDAQPRLLGERSERGYGTDFVKRWLHERHLNISIYIDILHEA